MRVGIAITLMGLNKNEVPQLIKLGEELGADQFSIFNFVPVGRGKEKISFDLSPIERDVILKAFLVAFANKRTVVSICNAPYFSRIAKQLIVENDIPVDVCNNLGDPGNVWLKAVGHLKDGCPVAKNTGLITPEGIVQPCPFLPIKTGNLRKQSFEDIWLHSKILSDLRNREKLKGRCHACSYRNICGGCRARAYAYYGDYLASDPGCMRALELIDT
jgi:radical SAM protein with 4Fe4S-binding SPASM domain